MTHSEENVLTSLTHELNLPINLPTLETSLDSHTSDEGEETQGL